MALPPPEELKKLSNADPEISTVSDQFRMTVDDSDPVFAIRQIRSLIDLSPVAPSIPEVTDSVAEYNTDDGVALKLCVFKPSSTQGPLPIFVWYHGGGGAIGKPEMTKAFCQEVASTHNCVVIAPQYRLGPEFKFPIGIEDCWAALRHIAQHASSYSADPRSGFLIGGESNGGGNAAAMSLLARDEKLNPPLTGVFLAAASFISPDNVPEKYKPWYQSRFDPQCLNAPLLDKKMKKIFDVTYAGDYNSHLFRAIIWPTGHRSLPKTYFQSCGMDINRDDSYIYQDVLKENGVETRLDVYPGCPHVFWSVFGQTTQGKKRRSDTTKGIAWLLEKSSEAEGSDF